MNDDHDNKITDQEQLPPESTPPPKDKRQPWTDNPVYNRSTACAQTSRKPKDQVDNRLPVPCRVCHHEHNTPLASTSLQNQPCLQCVANLAHIAAHATDELTELAGQLTFRTVQHTKQLNLLLEQINLLTDAVNSILDAHKNTDNTDNTDIYGKDEL